MATASLVTGILSLVFCWVPVLGVGLGIAGIVTSKPDENGKRNGLSIAGLVCGIVGLSICGIITVGVACSGIIACSQ